MLPSDALGLLQVPRCQLATISGILAKMGNLQLTPGSLFANRFEIDRAAGSGGMGTVYRARDQLSGDLVALKLLLAQGTEGGDTERFAREAQILAELRHPGIVSHVAHGLTHDGQRFLAMQWLDGEDLAQRLARGPLTLREALTLTERVSRALAFAHARGVIHRDLKPTNLFLHGGNIDQVKILDFGIARRLAASRAMTRTGMIIGTPEYMAPEQARGARELTPAADLFSLGCVLYECLAGDPPFLADHIAAVLVRILFEEPRPIAQRRLGIPGPVSDLLNRLLAKGPDQRMKDAGEVAEVVAKLGELADLPILPTLPAGAKPTPPHPDSEQVLLSLVLALPPHDMEGGSSTVLSEDVQNEIKRHGTILAELRALGAQADLLLGGALVATVPQMVSAKDQAALAARCAAKVKEHWPESRVVVVTGRGSRSRGGLTGEVLDRAWRLLGTSQATQEASTAQIRIDEVSAGLLESRFELFSLPTLTGAYALGGERLDPDAGRLLLGKPTACVGRERELTTLEAVYTECKEELLARAVLVLGPPGLGKSRLRHEFVRRLESRSEPVVILLGRGDPMKTKSAYGLLGEALRQRFEIRTGQSLDEQRARIRQRISTALPVAEVPRVTAFIGELCGVPFPDDECPQLRAARQDPRIMSEQVEQAWLDGLNLFRPTGPLLLILEDLHWSDALTVRLVDLALRRTRDHAFMVLALARPEVHDSYPNLWSGAFQALPLHPLPRKAGERLVRQILGAELASEETMRIVEQSAGNPLFLEELIRAAADGKNGMLPETVAAMIQARLGRLPATARRTLRSASVFGETFWENGVRDLLAVTHGEEMVQSDLADLMREEIIEKTSERRFVNEIQYRFRHALVRDAAYGLVSSDEKVAWHAAAGAFLEAAGEQAAVMTAEHFRLGQQLTHAAACYVKAAVQAYDIGDTDATLLCIERGLACDAQPEARAILLSLRIIIHFWREEFQEILALGPEALSLLPAGSKPWCRTLYALFPALILFQPHQIPDMMGQFLNAEPEADAIPMYVLAGAMLAIIFFVTGHKAPATLLRQRVHQFRQASNDRDPSLGHFHQMESYYFRYERGWPYSALCHIREAVLTANNVGNHQYRVAAAPFLGWYLFELGQKSSALEALRESLELAQRSKDAFSVLSAEVYLALVLARSTDLYSLHEAEKRGRACLQSRSPHIIGLAHGALAYASRQMGDLSAAALEAGRACEFLQPFPPLRLEFICLRSRLMREQGQNPDALRLCEEALQEMEALGIEPAGLLDLYVALAQAREHASQHEAARMAVQRALPILRRRVADIPDPAWRATYLYKVAENARLLELAAQWGFEITDLSQAAAVNKDTN